MKNLWKALGAMLIAGLAVGALIVNGAGAAGYGSSGKLKLSLDVNKQSKAKVLKKGLKVNVKVNKKAKVKLKAKKGSTTIGKGSDTLKKGVIKVKLNKKGEAAIKNAKGKFKFTVKGTATAGSKSASDSVSVKLK